LVKQLEEEGVLTFKSSKYHYKLERAKCSSEPRWYVRCRFWGKGFSTLAPGHCREWHSVGGKDDVGTLIAAILSEDHVTATPMRPQALIHTRVAEMHCGSGVYMYLR